MRNVAFFVVADGLGYLPKAIMALRSVQRFHPQAAFFVIGRFQDDTDAMEMISRHGLQFQYLDLSDVFVSTEPARQPSRWKQLIRIKSQTWPSESFWWFNAPNLLGDMGYDYSCVLDGDMLGVAPLQFNELFDGCAPMAAVAKRHGMVNAGILFLDHALLRDFGLFDKAVDNYHGTKTSGHAESSEFSRGWTDQTLLHNLEREHGLEVRRVANAYNHMLKWNEERYLKKNSDAPFSVSKSRILHLLNKPWQPPPRRGPLNPIMCEGYRLWWEFAREIWPDERERRQHFGRERDLPS